MAAPRACWKSARHWRRGDKTPASSQRSPYGLIAQAARLALDDTGAAGIGAAIDTVAMIRSFADAQTEKLFNRYSPGALRIFLSPMLSLLVTVPVTLLILGPLGY